MSDLASLQAAVFAPGAQVDVTLAFRNDGDVDWPRDARLKFVDGEECRAVVMDPSTQGAARSPVKPGDVYAFEMKLIAPPSAGTHASVWRLFSLAGGGFVSEPVYLMLTVGQSSLSEAAAHHPGASATPDSAMMMDDDEDL